MIQGDIMEMAEQLRVLISPVLICTAAQLPPAGTQWRRIAVVTDGPYVAYDDGTAWKILVSGTTPAGIHSEFSGRDAAESHPGTAISNTPAGNIAAVTVQAALNELDTEKVPTTRIISTTSPLAGGGALGADLTLSVGAASEAARGVVELATVAETKTGTDTERALTPASIANIVSLVTPATDGGILKSGEGVLTLSAAGAYTLTVPATGTAALLNTENVFSEKQYVSLDKTDPASSFVGLEGAVRLTITDDLNINTRGLRGYLSLKVASGKTLGATSQQTGGQYYIDIDSASAGTIVQIRNQFAYTNVKAGASGKITTYYGAIHQLQFSNPNTLHIDNFYGFSLFGLATLNGGSIDTAYQIYVGNTTAATTNYALYTNKGLVRLGDQASIVGSGDRQQFLVTGHTTQAVATPIAQITRNDTAAGGAAMLGLTALGGGANGDGGVIYLRGKSSTTAAQEMARIQYLWNDATHARRKADLILSAFDTTEREGLRVRGNGSAAALGVLGATPVARQAHIADATGGATVDTEARAAINAALAVLESFGFVATS